MNFANCKHKGKFTGQFFPDDLEKGLGDHLEDVFIKFGVTKKKWSTLLKTFQNENKSTTCGGCDSRHDFVNWAGTYLGFNEGKTKKLRDAIRDVTVQRQPIYYCAIHNKCIGRDTFAESLEENIIRLGVRPCQQCEDYKENG